MTNPSLFQLFEQSADRHAARTAVKDGGEELTYAQLRQRAREVGRGLIAMGVEQGDRVAIWGVNSLPWLLAGLGLQAAGAALVPLGTRLRGREVGGILGDSGALVVFADPMFGSYEYVAALCELDLPLRHIVVLSGDKPVDDPRVITMAELCAKGADVSDATLDQRIAGQSGDDLADILFTSGTTGRPKGVPMTQRQSIVACEDQNREVAMFTCEDVFAVTYPFAHNAGYRAGWQVSVLYGVKILPIAVFDPGAMLEMIECEGVTFLPTVPTIAQALLDHPDRPNRDLTSLRIVSTGGTTVPVRLIEDMQRYLGNDHTFVQTGYGLTETAGSVTTTRIDDGAEVVAKTIGSALKTLSVKIVGPAPDYADLPVGERGEIAVKGEQILKGYYNNPEATAKAFTPDGYLLTGDAAWVDEDGNYHITDRIKDMYLVGGFNCYPAEIEHMMRNIDGVAQVAVVGIDDERLGQVGRAFIIRQPGTDLTEDKVIAWCRAEMANYKVPRSVRFLESFPMNATGKVLKNELRDMV